MPPWRCCANCAITMPRWSGASSSRRWASRTRSSRVPTGAGRSSSMTRTLPAAEAALAAWERENLAATRPARADPSTAGPSPARPWGSAILAFAVYAGLPPSAESSSSGGSADAARMLKGEWWRAATALTLHADLAARRRQRRGARHLPRRSRAPAGPCARHLAGARRRHRGERAHGARRSRRPCVHRCLDGGLRRARHAERPPGAASSRVAHAGRRAWRSWGSWAPARGPTSSRTSSASPPASRRAWPYAALRRRDARSSSRPSRSWPSRPSLSPGGEHSRIDPRRSAPTHPKSCAN